MSPLNIRARTIRRRFGPAVAMGANMRAGIAFRPELAAWLGTRPREVRCLELSVDAALGAGQTFRARQIRRWPIALHAPHLAVGSVVAGRGADLDRLIAAIRATDPIWICGYLGARYRPETEPSYPQPVRLSGESLGRAVASCRRLIEAGVRPLLVENVAAFGVPGESLSPAHFINKLCDESGCGLMLDVTTLTLDQRLGFDPRRWLWDVDPSHVVAIRLRTASRQLASDSTGAGDSLVSDDGWTLAREIAARTTAETAVLECRGECPTIDELQGELCLAGAIDRFAPPVDALPAVARARV